MPHFGAVQGGIVIPDQSLAVPDGTRVQIEVSNPTTAAPGKRRGGWWRGQVSIAADFDELPDDIARGFGMDETLRPA